MPGSSTSLDKIGDVVARQDKFQRLIDAKLDQLLELREHIEAAIEGLPPNDRLLLRLRYIDGLTWEQVAVELHYGYQWTLKRHGRILQRLK